MIAPIHSLQFNPNYQTPFLSLPNYLTQESICQGHYAYENMSSYMNTFFFWAIFINQQNDKYSIDGLPSDEKGNY